MASYKAPSNLIESQSHKEALKHTHISRFRNAPLVTLERIRTEPRTVFARETWPRWVKSLELVSTSPDSDGPDDPNGHPSEAIILLGRTHARRVTVNLVALAVLFEMTRYGSISVHTNSNHAKSRPSIYPKMSFPNAPGHLVSIRRILFDADKGRATKPIWLEHDYSPENTRTEPDKHPRGQSRTIAMQHVEEAARKEASDPEAFLQNLRDLFVELDHIRDGDG